MMGRNKTTEEFIAESRAIHGDRYDYSHVVYVQSGKKVEIVCPIHGSFLKTPVGHLRGRGCNECKPKEKAAKVCDKCNIEKPIDLFLRKGKYYRNTCKECVRGHITSKVCNKCRVEKSVLEFGKIEDSADGYRYYCNECRRKESVKSGDSYNYRRRLKRKENPEESKQRGRDHYKNNRDRIRAWEKNNRQKNREQILFKQRKYRNEKRKEIRENYRVYSKNRRMTDMNFKLRGSLRNRIKDVLKRNNHRKCSHTMELLGCPIDSFKKHLESKFVMGMNWQNYGGKDGWQIDHIIPCVAFDLSKPEEQKKCFHFTNMQPLWAADNRRKHTTILAA